MRLTLGSSGKGRTVFLRRQVEAFMTRIPRNTIIPLRIRPLIESTSKLKGEDSKVTPPEKGSIGVIGPPKEVSSTFRCFEKALKSVRPHPGGSHTRFIQVPIQEFGTGERHARLMSRNDGFRQIQGRIGAFSVLLLELLLFLRREFPPKSGEARILPCMVNSIPRYLKNN